MEGSSIPMSMLNSEKAPLLALESKPCLLPASGLVMTRRLLPSGTVLNPAGLTESTLILYSPDSMVSSRAETSAEPEYRSWLAWISSVVSD